MRGLWTVVFLTACAPSPERVPHLPESVDGHFWVRLAPGAGADTLAGWDATLALPDAADAEAAAILGLDRTYLVQTDRWRAERIARHPDVAWVHPESVGHATAVPNDPDLGLQWHFEIVRATEAWDVSLGRGTRVAVIDSGVQPAVDGLGNFVERDCWDFIDFDDDCADPRGHGTHVSGTINQATHNAYGVAGLAPMTSIVPVRVIDADDHAPELAIAQGVIWAADQDCDVANMSLGGGGAMPLVEDAFAYALGAGTLIIATTGNNEWDDRVIFPAAYDQSMAVAATTIEDGRAWYSNAGPETDIAAPGGDLRYDLDGDGWNDGVIQETVTGAFEAWYGTSMAAPHVAATAALIVAQGLTHPDDVRRAIEASAVDLGEPGVDWEFGHGRLDAAAALAWTADELLPLDIVRTATREVAPGAVRVLWQSSKPTTGWVEGPDGAILARSVGLSERHSAELLGEPGESVWVDVIATEPGGDLVTEAVEVVF